MSVILLTLSVGAQSSGSNTTSEATLGDWYKKLRESPLSLYYSAWAGTARNRELAEKADRDANAIIGIQTFHYASLGLKLSPNDSISLSSAWLNAYAKDYETDDLHFFTDLTYTRKGLLNQKDHGINLSAGVRQRIFNDNYRNRKYKQTHYGFTAPRVSISRSLTDSLSFSTGIQYQLFNRSSGKAGIRENQWVITPTFAYQLSSDWSLSLSNSFIARNGKGGTKDHFMWDTTMSLGYSINSYLSVSFSVGSGFGGGISQAHDGRLFTRNLQDNVIYAVEASLSAF